MGLYSVTSFKICQRNNNLNSDGTCNVCEDVIAECKKKYDKIKNNCVIEKVKVEVLKNKFMSLGIEMFLKNLQKVKKTGHV